MRGAWHSFWLAACLYCTFVQSITYNIRCKLLAPLDRFIPCELANFGGLLSQEPKTYVINPSTDQLCAPSGENFSNDTALLTNHWGCSFMEKAVHAAKMGAGLILLTSSTNEPFAAGADSRDKSSMDVPFISIRLEDSEEIHSLLNSGKGLEVSVHAKISELEQCARRVHNYADADMTSMALDAYYRCPAEEGPAAAAASAAAAGPPAVVPAVAPGLERECRAALNLSRTLAGAEAVHEARDVLLAAKPSCWFPRSYSDWRDPSGHALYFDEGGRFVCEKQGEGGPPADFYDCGVSVDRVEFGIALHLADLHLKLGDITAATSAYGQAKNVIAAAADNKRRRRLLGEACGALALTTLARADPAGAVRLYRDCDLGPKDLAGNLLWAAAQSALAELVKLAPEALEEAAADRRVPAECCVPDWQAISGVPEKDRPACEQAVAHSLMGVFLDELGALDLAALHWRRLDALCSAAGAGLRSTLGTSVVAASEEEMEDERHTLLTKVKQITKAKKKQNLAFPLETLDYLWTQTPPTMMIGYQDLGDASALRKISEMYASVWPELASVSVTDLPDDDTSRPVRVGFASAFLGDHSVGRLINKVIEKLSRRADLEVVVLVCPAGGRPSGGGRLGRARAVDLPPELPLAGARVAELELDVLVYPEIGMHGFTYFLAMQRLAPVQVAFWGHPVSQGHAAIDYFLSSELFEEADPARAQRRHTEQLVLMESPATLFAPPAHEEGRRWKTRLNFGLPADAHLYLCAQTLMKFHPGFDGALRRVLAEDPDGILVVVYNDHQVLWRSKLEARFRRTLGREIARRVIFHPSLPRQDFQSLTALADVVLDPWPWGGGVTTLEALATGRVVVSLPGAQTAPQLAAGFLRLAGAGGLVAADVDEYVALAVAHGTNGTARAQIGSVIMDNQQALYSNKRVVGEWAQLLTKLARQHLL